MNNKLGKPKSSYNLYTEENTQKNLYFPIINSQNNKKFINHDLKKKNFKNLKGSNILKTQIFEIEETPKINVFYSNDFSEKNIEEAHKNFPTNKVNMKKKIIPNPKVELNNLLDKLINIRHKIRKFNQMNTSKLNFTSNNNNNTTNINKLKSITERTNSKLNLNTFYNNPVQKKKEHIESFKSLFNNKNKLKMLKNKKIKIKLNSKKNIVNNNSNNMFEEHKKFQGNLKSYKISNFLMKYKKEIDKNREEEMLHYKNRVLPDKTIEKLVKLRNSLTMQKFKIEYYEKIINP